jgi:hypothetical protein
MANFFSVAWLGKSNRFSGSVKCSRSVFYLAEPGRSTVFIPPPDKDMTSTAPASPTIHRAGRGTRHVRIGLRAWAAPPCSGTVLSPHVCPRATVARTGLRAPAVRGCSIASRRIRHRRQPISRRAPDQAGTQSFGERPQPNRSCTELA